MMKRVMAAVLLTAAALLCFVSCSGGQVGTCELCREENVSVREVNALGTTGLFCDNCYETAQIAADLANENL